MFSMFHAWIAVGVTVAVFVTLQLRRGVPVDLLFLGATVAVTLTGVITPAEALHGFANPAVITIGGLLVVASALRSTGVLDWVGQKLLGKVDREDRALRRLSITLVTTSALSAQHGLGRHDGSGWWWIGVGGATSHHHVF